MGTGQNDEFGEKPWGYPGPADVIVGSPVSFRADSSEMRGAAVCPLRAGGITILGLSETGGKDL